MDKDVFCRRGKQCLPDPGQAARDRPDRGDGAMAAIERDNPALKVVLLEDYDRPALDKARLGLQLEQQSAESERLQKAILINLGRLLP